VNIGIIGTRGIPNRYGGFEQLAERLSVGLSQRSHRVTVYNSHAHPYQLKDFGGVEIVHCYDAEKRLGTFGQFIYDLNCIRDARKKKFDVLLFLGYTSSSVWGRWFPKQSVIISNMDGMEWKREKYSKPVRNFLQHAEKLAVDHSDHFIADSPVIAAYLKDKYAIESEYIAYGADTAVVPNEALLEKYSLTRGNYFMLMARMEPENNIETILDGFHQSESDKYFIVLGNTNNGYGRSLKNKYSKDSRIIFAGSVFDNRITRSLINFSHIYFHGHSAGGTNPSLLEAMAAGALISAHGNDFNRAVLNKDAFYFTSSADVKRQVEMDLDPEIINSLKKNNLKKIEAQYNWPMIVEQYEAYISRCYNLAKS